MIGFIFFLLFFPVTLPYKIITGQFKIGVRILVVFISIFVIFPIWGTGYLIAGYFSVKGIYNLGLDVGLIQEENLVSGTGSMFPTFPKGKGKTIIEQRSETVAAHKMRKYPAGFVFNKKRFFGYDLQRGDIISFSNAKTQEIIEKETGSKEKTVYFIKRIIALPGDAIEIKNGFVYLNNHILSEPYTAKPRSTFGGEFLNDCKKLAIPQGFVFVMGDNRKESDDSRFDLGLVAKGDIDGVIPMGSQGDLKNNWRNTQNDAANSNLAVLDKDMYLKLLNEKRKEAGIPPLKYEPKLEKSADLRALVILKYNDLSFTATKSGYTMKKAMTDANYYNITWGEAPTLGYYDANELLNNYFQFPKTKNFLLNKDFQETGITAQIGEINGCPVQIVVSHFAGYIPPNYPKSEIDSWGSLIDSLYKVIPTWEGAKKYKNIDMDKLNKLIGLLYKRRQNAEIIYNRMKNNQWLTDEENQMVKEDDSLYNESAKLITELNSP